MFQTKSENLFHIFSFCHQLSDEPHLDGQDQDAAGEKVCAPLNYTVLCVV